MLIDHPCLVFAAVLQESLSTVLSTKKSARWNASATCCPCFSTALASRSINAKALSCPPSAYFTCSREMRFSSSHTTPIKINAF